MTFAPSVAPSFSAAPRSLKFADDASTRMMLQFWQTEWTVSTSSEISRSQPASSDGSGLVLPFSLTTSKQSPLDPHALGGPDVIDGRPNCASKLARSLAMFGSP